MSQALAVWWDASVVGTLRLEASGRMTFRYSDEWLAGADKPSLSVSLPKRPQPFRQRECRPFFAGLLPEEGQRLAVARRLGISAANDFGLLEAIGGDVAGAISLWPEGQSPPVAAGESVRTKPLDEKELAI